MRLSVCASLGLFLFGLAACHSASPSDGNDGEVRTFLEHYFSSWSAQDMDAYGHCFADQARITYLDAGGHADVQGVIDFVHGQRLAHQQSSERMNEKPLEMKIQGDNRIKQAAVTWVLKKGSQETRGTDFFTLQHDANGWKIISLVFYGDY